MSERPLNPPPVRFFVTLYRLGLGPLVGRLILLLTTTGRKSGLARVTALQYEEVDGALYLGSSRGMHADWVLNILADPRVDVRLKARRFSGLAEVVTDPVRVADFLELRLKLHPRMVGMILKSEGMPQCPSRKEMEDYASKLALVIVKPM